MGWPTSHRLTPAVAKKPRLSQTAHMPAILRAHGEVLLLLVVRAAAVSVDAQLYLLREMVTPVIAAYLHGTHDIPTLPNASSNNQPPPNSQPTPPTRPTIADLFLALFLALRPHSAAHFACGRARQSAEY